MRLNICLLLISTMIFSECKSKLTGTSTQNDKSYNEYQLIKVDLIGEFYVLHFKDSKRIHKVLSRKNDEIKTKKKNKLKLWNNYRLNLIPIYHNHDNSEPKIANYMSLERCVKFNTSVKICNEPGIELFVSDDLIGNFYDKENRNYDYIPSFEVRRRITL